MMLRPPISKINDSGGSVSKIRREWTIAIVPTTNAVTEAQVRTALQESYGIPSYFRFRYVVGVEGTHYRVASTSEYTEPVPLTDYTIVLFCGTDSPFDARDGIAGSNFGTSISVPCSVSPFSNNDFAYTVLHEMFHTFGISADAFANSHRETWVVPGLREYLYRRGDPESVACADLLAADMGAYPSYHYFSAFAYMSMLFEDAYPNNRDLEIPYRGTVVSHDHTIGYHTQAWNTITEKPIIFEQAASSANVSRPVGVVSTTTNGISPITISYLGTTVALSVRVILPKAKILSSGTEMRIKVQAPFTLLNASIVERDGATANGTTTPKAITFNGGVASITLSGLTSEVWSDWIVYAIDPTKDYLLTFDVASMSSYRRSNEDFGYGLYTAEGAFASSQNFTIGTDYSSYGYPAGFIALEVKTTALGVTTSAMYPRDATGEVTYVGASGILAQDSSKGCSLSPAGVNFLDGTRLPRWHGSKDTAPDTPGDGDEYYDTVTSKIRKYANGAWVDLN